MDAAIKKVHSLRKQARDYLIRQEFIEARIASNLAELKELQDAFNANFA